MPAALHQALALDPRSCERARLSRDPRFDGLFFTAVKTTQIYCRPVCPARPPKPNNVEYFPSAARCEQAGYRPCRRCRPELAPPSPRKAEDELAVGAMHRIEAGFLIEHRLEDLARAMGCSSRQLSRRFVQQYGVTPWQMHQTQRLLFAKQLLTETSLPITQLAYAAGFSSLRRFNDAFVRAYRMPPRDLRKGTSQGPTLRLRLGYRPPFDFDRMLAWLAPRMLVGTEDIVDGQYLRLIDAGDEHKPPAWLRLSPSDQHPHTLQLCLHHVEPRQILPIVRNLRRMFDLDANSHVLEQSLGSDPVLSKRVRQLSGLRIPGAFAPFEASVLAVLGQQVSVKAAVTLARRVHQRFGTALQDPPHPSLHHSFPSQRTLLDADLSGLGITSRRIATIGAVTRGLLEGQLSFDPAMPLATWCERWQAMPGIGPWTTQYLAMRAMSYPDVFPSGDLVLRKALSPDPKAPITSKAAASLAQRWSPWKSYAAFFLWNAWTPN